MIKIENLKVKYGDFTALNITEPLSFKDGERIGIIGSNGAGKSTLLKALLGLLPYEGSVQSDVNPNDIAVHMQSNNYVNTMPTKDIIEGILNTKIKENVKLQELIRFFEFEPNLKKKFQALSGGQKNRMTLLMVMYQDRKLTFFDEVTSGLDFETREKLMEKIIDYYKNKDASLLLVSHYYEELENLVDKILLLEKGQVVAFGTIAELFYKYCGKNTIIIKDTPEYQSIVKPFKKIFSAPGTIALRIDNQEEERQIIDELIRENIDFKRTTKDIELISINAKRSVQ